MDLNLDAWLKTMLPKHMKETHAALVKAIQEEGSIAWLVFQLGREWEKRCKTLW